MAKPEEELGEEQEEWVEPMRFWFSVWPFAYSIYEKVMLYDDAMDVEHKSKRANKALQFPHIIVPGSQAPVWALAVG